MAAAARALGLGVMLGCMLESGLGIAPAAHIASLCDHVDLDGNLLLRDDPWPGVRFEDGQPDPFGHAGSGRVPGTVPRLESDTEALRDPRRGLLRRPALREDGAGHPPLLAAPDGGDRRLDEGGGDDGRRARRRHDRRGPRVPADDGRRRGRDAGRPLPAGVEGAAPRVHRGGPGRRERAARVPRRRRRAVRARAGPRRRAPRPAPAARGHQRADRREPRGRREDRAHRRLGLRDRQEDGRRRARPGSAQPRPASVFCPTGQTGIAIAGWGIAVDAVVADFIAGAAERIVVEGAERGGRLLFVEGQGSLVHPLYSGVTLGLLHGAAPHALVLCHKAGETEIEGCPGHPIPPLPELVELHERVSLPARRSTVAAIALNTAGLGEDDARRAAAAVEDETGLATDDPVRFGSSRILDSVLARSGGDLDQTRLTPAAASADYVNRETTCLHSRCVRGCARDGRRGAARRRASAWRRTPRSTRTTAAPRSTRSSRRWGWTTNRITVHWDPADPTTIQEQGSWTALCRQQPGPAFASILDVYPSDRYAFTAGSPELRATLFGAYLQTLARRYPQVTDFIVGNEPNESYFWRPQFGPGKRQVSAAAFLRMMTAAYDALKSVDPKLRVIAAGPSNEGNDKTSTSPVRFIAALGDAYRASGALHAVHGRDGVPRLPAQQHASALEALQLAEHRPVRPREDQAGRLGCVRRHAAADVRPERPQLPRDLSGSSSASSAGRWQSARGSPRDTRTRRTCRRSPRPSRRSTTRELIRTFACDPAVTDAMIFHLVDEADLERFQSGLLRINRSKRPRTAPSPRPSGPQELAGVGRAGSRRAESSARRRSSRRADHPARTARSSASPSRPPRTRCAKAGIFRTSGPGARPQPGEVARSLAASSGELTPALRVAKTVKAGYTPRIEFRGPLAPGHYVYGVHLRAAVKPGRTRTFLSSTFEIAALTRTRVRCTMTNTCSLRHFSSRSPSRSSSPSRRGRRTAQARSSRYVVKRYDTLWSIATLALRGRSARGGVEDRAAQPTCPAPRSRRARCSGCRKSD